MAQWLMNLTRNHEVAVSIPDLARIPRCCGHWRRPVATALIRSLAWEPPYTVGAAQEMAKRQKIKNKNK